MRKENPRPSRALLTALLFLTAAAALLPATAPPAAGAQTPPCGEVRLRAARAHFRVGAYEMAKGDFNRDGHVDIVAVDSDNVVLLPGTGAGSFAAPRTFSAINSPRYLTAGDYNNDGLLDVAVGSELFAQQPFENVALLLGDGAGGFGPARRFTFGGTVQSLASGDFNRDGKLDLAFPRVPGISSSGSSVAVYAGDDAGHFDPNPIVTSLPFGPGFTVAGDFNEDGTPDLVTAPEGGSARFLAGDGAGRFGAATGLATTLFGAVNGLAAADFNGDGHLDVSTSSGQLFTGDGDGGFSAPYDYYVHGFVVTGDFDRDGKPDLAHTGNKPLTVVLNETCAAAPTPTPTPLPSPNPIDGSEFFVRQHYQDFLNREPDAPGLAFWKNQIDECTTDACREVRRVNVSAAFFLSIEFQETGYLAYCAHQSAFDKGERLKLSDFLKDTQELGAGVVVGQGDWRGQLRENQRKFFESFVQRPESLAAYPSTLAAESFVSKLDATHTTRGTRRAAGS